MIISIIWIMNRWIICRCSNFYQMLPAPVGNYIFPDQILNSLLLQTHISKSPSFITIFGHNSFKKHTEQYFSCRRYLHSQVPYSLKEITVRISLYLKELWPFLDRWYTLKLNQNLHHYIFKVFECMWSSKLKLSNSEI